MKCHVHVKITSFGEVYIAGFPGDPSAKGFGLCAQNAAKKIRRSRTRAPSAICKMAALDIEGQSGGYWHGETSQ